MSGIRIVSVGGSMTSQVALDSDVLVLDGVTLVRESTGRIIRLVERAGRVLEPPMSNLEFHHANSLFGERDG
ncbi:hypothetical protein [Microbacterium sp. P05]|uniref:hypothetical protein n=1 Tax=Microbacterium sp. P05 TaxID=3366948 RepID=UPI003744CADB